MKQKFKNHIILFDGVCNLCNSWVQRIIQWDKNQNFHFAALQSKEGEKVLNHYNIEQKSSRKQSYPSVILIEDGEVYSLSTAALRILKNLSGWWPLAYSFICIPKFIRDFFYRIIAQNRYRWFGKRKECMTPTPALKERFQIVTE